MGRANNYFHHDRANKNAAITVILPKYSTPSLLVVLHPPHKNQYVYNSVSKSSPWGLTQSMILLPPSSLTLGSRRPDWEILAYKVGSARKEAKGQTFSAAWKEPM